MKLQKKILPRTNPKKESEIFILKAHTWTTIDPYSGLDKETYTSAADADVENALATLHESFNEWSLLTVSERQQILQKFLARVTERKDEIAKLMSEEMGKPLQDSVGEIKKCIQTTESYLKFDYGFLQQQKISSVYKESQIHNQPLGIIYSIMPWNFPFFQVIRMIVPSLLGGNVVLLKHSEITPKTGEIFNSLFENIWSRPIFKFLLLTHEVTDLIVGDVRVGGVSLTGSTDAGAAISAAAGKYMKKVVLELGGSDPAVICYDADLSEAAKNVARGRLLNTGQSCICIKRCLVDAKILEPFLNLLKAEFESYQFGDPMNMETDLGPLAHPKFKKSHLEQTAEFKKVTGAQLIYSKAHGQSEKSAFVNSEIYLLQENSQWLKDQEFFAPLLVVIPFHSENEAIFIANSTDFALGASIWSKDVTRAKKVAASIVAGQVAINDIVKSDMTLPFGGFKRSGLGRELSPLGILEFTQAKVISFS